MRQILISDHIYFQFLVVTPTGCLCSDDPYRFRDIAMVGSFLRVIPHMIPMLVVKKLVQFGGALDVLFVQAVAAAVLGVTARVRHHPAQRHETRWASRHPKTDSLLQPSVRVLAAKSIINLTLFLTIK